MHPLTGRWKHALLLLLALAVSPAMRASLDLLRSGPMLGYAEMREVAVWVQTHKPAEVQLIYWPQGNDDDIRESLPQQTHESSSCAVTLIANKVTPGTRYEYLITLNGDPVALPYRLEFQTLPDWRNHTPPPDFKLALVGQHYVNQPPYEHPYKKIGEGYEAFEVIQSLRPDAMLWVGTAHLREADWGSRSGYLERYSSARAQPDMAPLLASAHHYGLWAVHDYGPSRASGSWLMREEARTAFQLFWPTPSAGVPGLGGITSSFRWGDAEFFMLDVRTHRQNHAVHKAKRKILGETQLDWLKENLRTSPATFKIVVAGLPILNPAPDEANFVYADKERDELLRFLEDEKIPGIFFVSGGRPFGEMTKLVRGASYPLYDLSLGPVTERPIPKSDELNYFRVPGTRVHERSFATLYFTGPEDQRVLMVAVHNTKGEVIWKDTLPPGTVQ